MGQLTDTGDGATGMHMAPTAAEPVTIPSTRWDMLADQPRPRYDATPCSGNHSPRGGGPVCQNTSIGMPPRGYQ